MVWGGDEYEYLVAGEEGGEGSSSGLGQGSAIGYRGYSEDQVSTRRSLESAFAHPLGGRVRGEAERVFNVFCSRAVFYSKRRTSNDTAHP